MLNDFSAGQFATFVSVWAVFFLIEYKKGTFNPEPFDPIETYGWTYSISIYLIKLFIFIGTFPLVGFNVIGTWFVDKPNQKQLIDLPCSGTICFRVVTRGNSPDLVRQTMGHNIDVIKSIGKIKFTYEIVTDNAIGLEANETCYELVVPTYYKTKTGAKYKARALQYSLEQNMSLLKSSDWVVHLDEETLVTKSSVLGIVDFVNKNKYPIGQGMSSEFYFPHN
jgi:egghead protein (zeste-white 4 protein)